MFYADKLVGLLKVIEAMRGFAANPSADPRFWQPAPWLLRQTEKATGK
jgi:hypothetical protein